MKNQIRTLTFLALTAVLSFASVGCDKKKNNSVSTIFGTINGVCYNLTANTQATIDNCAGTAMQRATFSYSGANCMNTRTNQTVNNAYCTSNPYYFTGNQCIDSLTNKQSEFFYCADAVYSGPAAAGTNGSQCYGLYWYQQNGAWQQVQCSGANCRGYTLTTDTGALIRCQ